MTGPNSYGSTQDVAALVPRYAGTAGDFTPSTRPTIAQVERLVDQVSGLLNATLAEAGFAIPVTQSDAKDALDFFVNEEVASICEGINGSGRFGPTSKVVGKQGRFSLMLDDVQAFIQSHKAGFERLGAARSFSATSGLAFRDTNNAGDPTAPIFQRTGFGNTFDDWDPA